MSKHVQTTDRGPVELLREAVFWIDAAASHDGVAVRNLGRGGSVLDASYGATPGYGSGDTTEPLFLDWTGQNYFYQPGVAGNYLSVPDANEFDILGDIDLRVYATFDTWKPSGTVYYASKMENGDPNRAWRLSLNANGYMAFEWWPTGSNAGILGAVSTVPVTSVAAEGQAKWLRTTLDVDNGAAGCDIKFWTSDDGLNWTQLGATVTKAGTTAMVATTSNVALGCYGGDAGTAGKYYRLQVLNGIGGTTVLDVDTSRIASGGATTLTALTGHTVNIIRSTSGRKGVCVTQPCWLFGTDDYLEVADNDLLDFSASDSFTVVAIVRQWATQATGSLISKKYDFAASAGWSIYNTSTQNVFKFGDGSTFGSTVGTFATGTVGVYVGQRNVATDSALLYYSGTWFAPSADNTTTTLVNSEVMRIGRLSGAGTGYQDFEGIAFAVFRRLLTADEITIITDYYNSRKGKPAIPTPQITGSPSTALVTTTTGQTSFGSSGVVATQAISGKVVSGQSVPDLMRDAVWWIDAAASPDGQYARNLGRGGTTLDAVYGSSVASSTDEPTFLDWQGQNYVYLPGVAGNYLSVPDETALDITGDIDIRVKVALDDWTPAADTPLLTKYNTTANRSYRVWVSATTGRLNFAWSADGAVGNTVQSTVAPTVSDGQALWVRVTFDVDNGSTQNVVTFYTAVDSASVPPSWTQLGTAVTTAGVASLFAGTATLEIGAYTSGPNYLAAKVYRAQVLNGIGGTTVLDVDTSVVSSGAATTFTALTGQTVTINRATSGRKAVMVTQPVWLFGTDDYMSVADNDILDMAATDSFTVLAAVRDWNSGTDRCLVTKKAGGTAASPGYSLNNYQSAVAGTDAYIADGTAQVNAYVPSGSAGSLLLTAVVRDVAADAIIAYANGTAATFSDTTTGSLANSSSLVVGNGPYGYLAGELVAAAVFRRALTPDEIAAITNWYLNRAGKPAIPLSQITTSAGKTAITGAATLELSASGLNSSVAVNAPVISGRKPEELMQEAVLWIDAAGSYDSGYARNLGAGGSVLDATVTGPVYLPWEGQNYVYLPGVAANYLSVPDEAALDITGDIDIRCRVALDDWTPAATTTLVSKNDLASQYSYYFAVNSATGTLRFVWSATGAAGAVIDKASTVAPTVTDGSTIWVRVTLDVDNGAAGNDVKFWQSSDGSSWTQVGSTVTTAGTTSIWAGTTALAVGARVSDGANPLAGKVYRAQVLNGIAGTTVLDIDTSVVTGSATSFTALTGQTVTVNRATTGPKTVCVTQPVYLFGTDDYMEVADSDLLDFTATDSFSIVAVVRQWGTPIGQIMAKTAAITASMSGWSAQADSTVWRIPQFGDGAVRSIAYSGLYVAGAITPIVGVRNVATDYVMGYGGSGAGAGTVDATTATIATADVMRIGRLSGAGTQYTDMEFVAAAVFRRALTADEITAITNWYLTRKGSPIVPSGHLAITSSNVAIRNATSNPALLITQTGTGNALVVEDVASDTTPFVIDASGNVTTGGTLTVYGTTATVGTGAGNALIDANGGAGSSRTLRLRTAGVDRWQVGANSTAETGSDVGSNFFVNRYSDAGAGLGTVLQINRATGALTYTGSNFTVSGNATTVGDGTASASFSIAGAAATLRQLFFKTGSNLRWAFAADSVAESGTNAGSSLAISRYDDAGAYIDSPFTITRSTGLVTINTGGLTVNANTILGGNSTSLSNAPASGGAAGVEIGSGRPDAGLSFLDFHSTAGSDYEARIMRASGTNGTLNIQNAGTGTVLVDINGKNQMQVYDGAMTLLSNTPNAAGSATVEIGSSRPDAGNAIIDLHATAGSDYDARIIRNSGTNGNLDITNNGTGDIFFNQNGKTTAAINQTGMTYLSHTPSSGQAAVVEIGGARPDAGNAWIDLHATAGSDYDSRIQRSSGTNGSLDISNQGTGQISFYINGTQRLTIDNTGLLSVPGGSGLSLGAWTAYVPTLTGTGWAIGNGTIVGAYSQIGKIVHFRVRVTFGSTSTYGASAAPTLSVPVSSIAAPGSALMHNFGVTYYDSSAAAYYRGGALSGGVSTVLLSVIGTNGAETNATATAPFTWASGDMIDLSGTYEAA